MCARCVVRTSRTVVRRCLCRSSSAKPMCARCVAFITGEEGEGAENRAADRERGLIFPPCLFLPSSLDQTWRHSSDFFVLVPLPADAGGERIGRRSFFHFFCAGLFDSSDPPLKEKSGPRSSCFLHRGSPNTLFITCVNPSKKGFAERGGGRRRSLEGGIVFHYCQEEGEGRRENLLHDKRGG